MMRAPDITLPLPHYSGDFTRKRMLMPPLTPHDTPRGGWEDIGDIISLLDAPLPPLPTYMLPRVRSSSPPHDVLDALEMPAMGIRLQLRRRRACAAHYLYGATCCFLHAATRSF